MYRPLALRSQRPPAASRPRVNRGWMPDTGGGLLAACLVWVLILYLVIPLQYFTGEMDIAPELLMSGPNVLARTIKLGLLTLSVAILLWRARLTWFELRSLNPFLLLFLALVLCSASWSIDASATLNRFVSLLAIMSVCCAFTLWGWHRTRFQDVVRPVVTLLLLGSIVWGLVYPQYAIEVGEGTLKNAWRGLAAQKNQFGMLASFGAVFWLHAWLAREKRWWLALPLIGFSVYCVLLSRSSTALLATTLSMLFILMVLATPSNLRRYMPYAVTSFAVLVVIYALAVLNLIPGIGILLDPIAELSGKDMTFSNRAVIWGIIKEHIQFAPILGSGYGAYWTGPLPSSPSYVFLSKMYFYPTESHNGYIEIVNDLGAVGLLCLLGYLAMWVKQSLQLMKFDRSQGVLFLALFFQQAITNLSESTWLAINSAFAIAIMTLATFSLSRSLLELRLVESLGVLAVPRTPIRR
jgi:exopolysaccharide production protein ExoQ